MRVRWGEIVVVEANTDVDEKAATSHHGVGGLRVGKGRIIPPEVDTLRQEFREKRLPL